MSAKSSTWGFVEDKNSNQIKLDDWDLRDIQASENPDMSLQRGRFKERATQEKGYRRGSPRMA